jgi:hypothetical protein
MTHMMLLQRRRLPQRCRPSCALVAADIRVWRNGFDSYTGKPYSQIVNVRVFATSRYEKQVRRLLAEPEQAAMQFAIAADPEAHPVVPGTGGVRKARWARPGKGKSGGVRVIYYYSRTTEEITMQILDPEVYLLSIYAKSDQSDMTAADRKAARKFVEGLKHAKKQADK